jgi:hypothetical protein
MRIFIIMYNDDLLYEKIFKKLDSVAKKLIDNSERLCWEERNRSFLKASSSSTIIHDSITGNPIAKIMLNNSLKIEITKFSL